MNDHYLPKNQRKNKPSKKDNKNEQTQSKIDNNSKSGENKQEGLLNVSVLQSKKFHVAGANIWKTNKTLKYEKENSYKRQSV